MPVERIAEWALTRADEAAITDLLGRAFGDFSGRSFYKQRHHVRLIQRDGDRIVGHLAMCFRAVRLGDRILTIAGIAEVGTDPDCRGRGIASALLQDAVDLAKGTMAEAVVLFGDRPLYAGHGFRRVGNRMRFAAMEGLRSLDVREDTDDGLMILPLTDANWDETVLLDLLGPMF